MEDEIRKNDDWVRGTEVELLQARAIIWIPENAVEGDMIFKIYHNGQIREVRRTMDMKEIREAIRKGEDYIDDDDIFVLTEKGKDALLTEESMP